MNRHILTYDVLAWRKKNRRKKKHSLPLRYETISCAILLFVLCHLLPVLEGTGTPVRIFHTRAFFRIIFIIFLFFFLLVALFNPASQKIRRSEIDESPGRRWRQCCLMMTFKCGAASFDCSRGVARRDAFFFVSLFLVFLSLLIFHFLVNILFFSFYPF